MEVYEEATEAVMEEENRMEMQQAAAADAEAVVRASACAEGFGISPGERRRPFSGRPARVGRRDDPAAGLRGRLHPVPDRLPPDK